MKKLRAQIYYYLATGFGVGLIPFAPGTMGSLLAVILALLLFPANGILQLLLVAVTILVAIYSSHWLAEAEDREDPSHVVIDEIAGMFLTLLWLPLPLGWTAWVAAFLLFRVFDIWKPWPVNKCEKLPGGLGIVLDDVAAGVLANIVLQIWLRFF